MGMQHGHGHAAWTWACSMDMNIQNEHRHGREQVMDIDCYSAVNSGQLLFLESFAEVRES
jgi:hypothetical protein